MSTHIVIRQIQGDRLYVPDELIDTSDWPEENVQALIGLGDLRPITVTDLEFDMAASGKPTRGRGRPRKDGGES